MARQILFKLNWGAVTSQLYSLYTSQNFLKENISISWKTEQGMQSCLKNGSGTKLVNVLSSKVDIENSILILFHTNETIKAVMKMTNVECKPKV